MAAHALTETDSVVLHASRRWWNKVNLRRGETPWLTFASKRSANSLNGKDIVGEFKKPGRYYLGIKVDIRLPRELPDEIQVLLIWFYFIAFVADAAST